MAKTRGKACWKITYMTIGRVEYTREIEYINFLKKHGEIGKYIQLDFISNPPVAVEVLFMKDEN